MGISFDELPYRIEIPADGEWTIAVLVEQFTNSRIWVDGVCRSEVRNHRQPIDNTWFAVYELTAGQVVALETDGVMRRFAADPVVGS